MKLFAVTLTLLLGSYCVGQQHIYPDSLQGYYPFSLQGTDDESGNNNNPTIIGNMFYENIGNSGGYHIFQYGYPDMGDVDAFEGTDSLTLFSIVLTDAQNFGGNNDESEFLPLISKWTVGDISNSSYRVYMNGSRLVAEFSDGVNSDSVSYDIWFGLLCCDWTPITITFASGEVKIYESWLEVASKNLNISSINNSSSNFYLGNMNNQNDPNYETFKGVIDETMIYNSTLSLCEFTNFHLEEYTYPLNNRWSNQCQCLNAYYVMTDTYQWYDCDTQTEILGETGSIFEPTSDGNYACLVSYHNGCMDTTDCVEVIGLGLDEELLNSDFSVYPNPSNGDVTIQIDEGIEVTEIEIVDLNGRVLETVPFSETITINKPSGIYLLQLLHSNEVVGTRRIMISF